jgi:quinol-cytochrome oxidoreductase complex cytochrome b subunit
VKRAIVAWLRARYPVDEWGEALREGLGAPIPRTAGWSHTTGLAIASLLAAQVLTGVLLLADYRGDPASAHRSVQAIATEVPLGWLARGIHHWGASLVVALALLHLAKAYWAGAHKRPRELLWATGALLLLTILALAFTGALLPYDQLAYWGTTVATEAIGSVPLVGPRALHIVRGGDDVSGATLGRFLAAHVVVLPAVLAALLALHLALVRHHGVTPRASVDEEDALGRDAFARGGEPYVPHHLLREAIAAIVALAVLLTLALAFPVGVGPPADPLATPPGVRPEWYFLPGYQVLKLFPSRVGPFDGSTLGALVAAAPLLLLVALPFMDRSKERRPSRRKLSIAIAALFAVGVFALGAAGHLAGRTVALFGRTIRFDLLARPTIGPDGGP